MEKLITPVFPESPDYHLSPQQEFFLLGSCFSQHMGQFLVNNRISACVNPFGTVFNPHTISQLISRIVNRKYYTLDDITGYDGRFFSFEVYTLFTGSTPEQVIKQLNEELDRAIFHFDRMDFLLLTFGTSYVFRKKTDHAIVGNCHKMPNHYFTGYQLTHTEVVDILRLIGDLVKQLRPNAKIITTISPVRHLSAGLVQNTVSKAVLHSALHCFMPQQDWSYFPAYEIMMDELRDYRYYADDLIHPTPLAIRIICERFLKSYFTAESHRYIAQAKELKSLLEHKPRSTDLGKLELLESKIQAKVNEILQQHEIDWSAEIKQWRDRSISDQQNGT